MMNKILQLLGILTFVICNYGNAKELKCEYELKNLNIEPVRVANAKRTYTVYISCKYTSVHHTGANTAAKDNYPGSNRYR